MENYDLLIICSTLFFILFYAAEWYLLELLYVEAFAVWKLNNNSQKRICICSISHRLEVYCHLHGITSYKKKCLSNEENCANTRIHSIENPN